MDVLHLKSPGNWINDPNGFIYYKNYYHLYYQHFPYEPIWGTMHWGHAISKDLVHWEHCGIAVYPSKDYDKNGVFSGNAIVIDDKLCLYYTGVKYPNPNPEYIHLTADYMLEASQVLIVSNDGMHFDNFNGKTMVIAPSDDDDKMSRCDTRDPKVWKSDETGKYIMILGSTHKNRGRLIFMESEDGYAWTQKAQYESTEFGRIFECPDMFEIDGRKVIFCAATDYLDDGLSNNAQEIYKFVQLDETDFSFSWEKETHYLDYGTDLYATQTNIDEYGNRVFIAWMRMPEAMNYYEDEKSIIPGAEQFSGIMTMPRVISYKNGHLYFVPHPNVDKLFDDKREIDELCNVDIQNAENVSAFSSKEASHIIKISADLRDNAMLNLDGYVIRYLDGKIVTDRSECYPAGNHRFACETPVLNDGTHVDIYIDRHIIEIYANGGEYVLSNVIY